MTTFTAGCSIAGIFLVVNLTPYPRATLNTAVTNKQRNVNSVPRYKTTRSCLLWSCQSSLAIWRKMKFFCIFQHRFCWFYKQKGEGTGKPNRIILKSQAYYANCHRRYCISWLNCTSRGDQDTRRIITIQCTSVLHSKRFSMLGYLHVWIVQSVETRYIRLRY